MGPNSLVNLLVYVEILLCATALSVIIWRRQFRDYMWLGYFLAIRITADCVFITLHMAAGHALGRTTAYKLYFHAYWFSFAIESIMALMVVHGIFKLAMAPLKGLQTLGMLVFRWAAGISVAVAMSSAFAPHMSGINYLVAAASQLQRTQSILTLCLLLFVTFAIRPMGLSYKSRIFGVSLGLGIMSTNDLVHSAWIVLHPGLQGAYNQINGMIICFILIIWTAYFALPEPKRRMIILPTTSPFLRWNQISQALGDDPGFVAVGGIPPEMFAPAEIEVMRRASLKMAPSIAEFPMSTLSEERLSASRAI